LTVTPTARHLAAGLACLAILGGQAIPLFAHTGDVYFAATGRAVVDGDLSEWPSTAWSALPYYTPMLGAHRDAADLSAEYALMWSADTLFIAARVRDDVHFSQRQGSDTWIDDQLGVRFLRVHQPAASAWYEAVSWSYSLSSSPGSDAGEGDVKVEYPPEGLEYLAHRVVRLDEEGLTAYEAAVRPPFALAAGLVMGCNVAATDNDGEGPRGYLTAARTDHFAFPQIGEGDVVFVEDQAAPATLSGHVERAIVGHTCVHVHRGEEYVSSALVDEHGAFRVPLLAGAYTLRAHGGDHASDSAQVTIAGSAPLNIDLRLDRRLGSICGRVRSMDLADPVPRASVWARQDGRNVARAIADSNGIYQLVGLETGTYDLSCSVTEDQVIEGIEVAEGETVAAPQDFRSALTFAREPWDDACYDVLLESYAYDREQPLRARVLGRSTAGGYRREKISFESLDDQVMAYLALPEFAPAPVPCILMLHGRINLGKDRPLLEQLRRDLASAGYAALALDTRYFNERHVRGESVHDLGGQLYRRQNAWFRDTIIDCRRAIDYLSERTEIDSTRIGIIGGSMGAQQCTILGAVEERVRAVVLRGPGLYADQWEPGVYDRLNFAARIDKPVLILTGPYDGPWAVQGGQHLARVIPGPTAIKWYPTGHTVPPHLYRDDLIAWLGRNL